MPNLRVEVQVVHVVMSMKTWD